MDRDKMKRKPRSGENYVDCRRNKEQKLMESPRPTISTHLTGNVNSETPKSSDLTQALVAMWFNGTPGEPFMTQEVREGIALKDCQEKRLEAENMVHALKSQVSKAHVMINEMNKTLKAEETSNAQLMSNLNHTRDLAATIQDMVNYITANLQRCKQHKDHLSDLYNDVILTQKKKYEKLESREKALQQKINDLKSTIVDLDENLKVARATQEDHSNQMRKAFETELTELRNDCAKTCRDLEKISAEKTNIQSKLEGLAAKNKDLEKNIEKYENSMATVEAQLTKTLTERKIIEEENISLKNEIYVKNNEITVIAGQLESALTKQEEQSVEITTIQNDNKSLEEKIKIEIEQRANLEKSFEAVNERTQELEMQVKSLKQKKDEILEDMQRNIDNAAKESREMASEAKKESEEQKTKHELLVKSLIENYESSVSEMKLLKSRHQSELSEIHKSSDSMMTNCAKENRQLEDAVNALKREKATLQTEIKQIEDLLKKHLDSEKQIRAKLDSQTVAMQNEKKRRDKDTQKHINKIQELEKKLLNLEFSQNHSATVDKTASVVLTKSDPKVIESVKKKPSVSTYKKSILKREPNRRKTRSTPPSPGSGVQPISKKTDDKKIKFHFDSSSDASPVQLTRTPALSNFMDDDDLFDNLLGKSCSQPLQSSQTLKFQEQPTQRKFFKAASSQSK